MVLDPLLTDLVTATDYVSRPFLTFFLNFCMPRFHSALSMPQLACSVTCVTPICLGAMAMLPLAGFAHFYHSNLVTYSVVAAGSALCVGLAVSVMAAVAAVLCHLQHLLYLLLSCLLCSGASCPSSSPWFCSWFCSLHMTAILTSCNNSP